MGERFGGVAGGDAAAGDGDEGHEFVGVGL
jgi:hypothetical protein